MSTYTSTIFSKGHGFLEGPRWHDGQLWASDFLTKQVMVFDTDGEPTTVAHVEGTPSGIGFLPDGTALVVSMTDHKVLRILPDGSTDDYADFSAVAGGAGNDMLVAPSGDCYVGNFGFALGQEDPRPTNLAHVDRNGVVHRVEGDVLFPNGEALTPAGALLVAESFGHRISAFDVQADGSLANKRVWAQMDDSMKPDGICLDADGGVWFGNVLTNGPETGFYRVVEGGEITDKVEVHVEGAWAVACVFGGPDLGTFFCISTETTLEDFGAGRASAVIATADVQRKGAVVA